MPTAGQWLTELKFDGYRIVSHVDGERVQCFTRRGLDWTHRMPRVAPALASLGLRESWLDGELVAVDERGVPQFQRLQQALDPTSGEEPVLMVFDALQLLGADLRAKPQRERKRLLQQALAELPRAGLVRLVDSSTARARRCESRRAHRATKASSSRTRTPGTAPAATAPGSSSSAGASRSS